MATLTKPFGLLLSLEFFTTGWQIVTLIQLPPPFWEFPEFVFELPPEFGDCPT